MHPILLSLGSFKIYTYGFFVALAFMTTIFYLSYSMKSSKKKLISYDELYSLFMYMVIFAIIGARSFFVFINLKDFFLNPLDIFKIWKGGLVYYGGFIGAVVFMLVYAKKKNIIIFKLGDFFAPALALGHAIGRIGCFFAGCCYGKASDLPWAVTFTNKYSLAVREVRLHPTQLYEFIVNFLLFMFLHFYSKKNSKTSGMSLVIYLISYTLARFIIEFFRDDYRGMKCFGFSISQIISVFLFIIGVLIIWKKKLYMKSLKMRD
ncbi:MAG: prolipoprotein diacylglyceryl transferase [Endomicrobium sp.]|jgi:phosphatidylglycerol:prolipoprotein diacylglycerol transferase|nr:prolipoprotein diacylglyceryl transferase [Endomicrobium sp.]